MEERSAVLSTREGRRVPSGEAAAATELSLEGDPLLVSLGLLQEGDQLPRD